MAEHNHMTRDIKPVGQCPACDRHHERAAEVLRSAQRVKQQRGKCDTVEAPFLSVPSGLDIAHYFWDETDRRNRGCEGIDLYRDGDDYCYLWVEAMVDLDLWHAYLLEVRTHVAVPPGEIGETRDYLYLFAGAEGRFDVEWHNHPIDFAASSDAHWARFVSGMEWLTRLIEKSVEDANGGHDHTAECCREHGTHSTPHVGCILR